MNNNFRQYFPIFQRKIDKYPLIYLDSAATTQKPYEVLKSIESFYRKNNANIHRGVYKLSEQASSMYENTRISIAKFINAKTPQEIIFVRGATEAINLVAASYGQENFKIGDEIIVSLMEHHSNIVPWQMICKKIGANLKIIKIHEDGQIDLENYKNLFNKNTKMVAITHVSNTLGTINNIKKIINFAHAYKVPILIDGAQAIAHLPVDVQDLDCDFYVFSAHKMYGPTGIGILYGKENILDSMPPYQGGGGMISYVNFDNTEYALLPQKFEAGTPNISGVVGFGAAINFIKKIGIDTIIKHENSLLLYTIDKLEQLNDITIIGKTKNKIGIISFIMNMVHPHDLATILDKDGIAVRAGHHCTMPLLDFYKVNGTIRISFGIYNTKDDIDRLCLALNKVKTIFN